MKHVLFKRGRTAVRPYVIALCILLSALCVFAFAVTYRVDPANGPETLAAEVKEAFDAWVALSDKIEVKETQENPEGVFQYGDTERFGPDTLSLTVQRQGDTRSLSYLISPNAENRKRILLHETGIAIGLTPQIPGTPLPDAPTPPADSTPTEQPTNPDESTPSSESASPTESSTPSETSGATESSTTEGQSSTEPTTQPSTEESTTEQNPSESSSEENTTTQPTENQTAGETSSTETSDSTTTSEESSTATDTTSTDTTSTDTTTEQPTDTAPKEGTETPALTPNSVMNPSISPDDSTELGDAEKQLIERLQLFAKQDINKDGVVNFYDLVALSQAFGRTDVNDPADINKDGVVDQGDVDELQKVYTFSDPAEKAPGSSGTEPTDGTTPAETPADGTTPPEDLPPPQEDGTLPGDGNTP